MSEQPLFYKNTLEKISSAGQKASTTEEIFNDLAKMAKESNAALSELRISWGGERTEKYEAQMVFHITTRQELEYVGGSPLTRLEKVKRFFKRILNFGKLPLTSGVTVNSCPDLSKEEKAGIINYLAEQAVESGEDFAELSMLIGSKGESSVYLCKLYFIVGTPELLEEESRIRNQEEPEEDPVVAANMDNDLEIKQVMDHIDKSNKIRRVCISKNFETGEESISVEGK